VSKSNVLFSMILTLAVAMPTMAWSADPSPIASSANQGTAFDQVFAEWKQMLAEMRQLRSEHPQASPERRAEIEKRYAALVAQGEATLPKLIRAAEASYCEAPDQRRPQADFLLAIVVDRFQADDHEEAMRLARVLIGKGHGEHDQRTFAWGGLAAFAVGDFDAAETWLTQAKQAGALEKLPKSLITTAQGCLRDIPYYKDAWKREQELRAAEAKANDLPRVLLKTSKGDIEVELFENEAPIATANFVSLVEKGFYNGTPFHRVLPAFMAQGGDPTGTGTGGPGYAIPCECYQPNHRIHFRGSLSMAHAGRDTGGSQFFLTFSPAHHLDGRHTVFGRVVKGIDVLAKIQRRDPQDDDAPQPDKIVEAKVLRKRPHPYEPKKLPDPRSPR
jgi:cyclophilin family peptidyl-prolyl cis-trans isomerase